VSATADSYISEVTAEQKSNFNTDARLRLSGVAASRRRTVVAFDLSALPAGSSVRSAVLHLALGATLTEGRTFAVHALSQTFEEIRVSWDRATQAAKWITPGGDTAVQESARTTVGPGAQAGAIVDFDLTYDVGLIAKGSWPNYGWLVESAADEQSAEFVPRESAFPSERPRLELTLCP
jgi:hypothetical protein